MSQYVLSNPDITSSSSKNNVSSNATLNHISIPIKSINKTETVKPTNTTPKSPPTSGVITNQTNAKNAIKVQTEFMQAMTNAIIRCVDKNEDIDKREAEKSVFIALGYDPSIESQNNNNLEEKISHFRRHHIMRSRDAIRTFRIKEMHKNIIQKYPNYTNNDVLSHLMSKLKLLYLPSPSPPPVTVIPVDNKPSPVINSEEKQHKNKKYIDCNNKLEANKRKNRSKHNKNNTIYGINDKYRQRQSLLNNNRRKNVNYSINQWNKPIIKSKKKQFNTNNDNINRANQRPLKYKKNNKFKANNKLLFKQSIMNNKKPIKLSKKAKPARYYTGDYDGLHAYKHQHIYYNDQEIINQKIKLHKKSRKRKLHNFDTFDAFEDFDNKPPKKRTRMDIRSTHTHAAHSDQSDIDNIDNKT